MTKENQEDKNSCKSEVALREERILEFWKENKTFEKSLKQTEGKKEFIFFEGPPTANGTPGIHHLEARAFKDAIPRYKTMRGFHVRRKGGWDTHGLPVELQVEKKLELNSKKAIEEYGIAKFNQECKESVWEYLDVWNKFTHRIGYWVDQENPYVTYHNDYIESVWNIVKEINKQDLLYKDYKVVPWCPRCGTALSSHELAQGYEDVKDLSVYVKFRVLGGNVAFTGSLSVSVDTALPLGSSACETPCKSNIPTSTYILAWTTTPWTLPGNVALAVGKDIEYVKIEKEKEFLILAKERLSVIDGDYKIIEEFKGKDLIGLEYEPLYGFLENEIRQNKEESAKMINAYKIYPADFVTTEDGTGVVHIAPMYGVNDFELGTKVGLPKHHLVGLDGKFLPGTGIFEGRFVKDEQVAVDVIKDLAHRGLLFKKEKYEHSYPHCWRCKTALIYYARDSWYIKVSDPKIKDKMIAENKEINWEPAYTRDGRFGEWLREIKDWAISRERYWGTPLPVWICETCKKVDVIGGIEDLKNKTKKSGNKYFIMRHGASEANLENKVSCHVGDVDHLTEDGRKQVLKVIPGLKDKKINLIISSDFLRTQETAKIIKDELSIKDADFILDKKIREFNAGIFEGKTWNEYYDSREEKDWYSYKSENGESCKDMKFRMIDFLYGIEEKYKNRNVLIISHEGPIRMLLAGIKGWNDEETSKRLQKEIPNLKNTDILELDFVPLPHNENYELDLHKPFIDEINLECECGGKLIRTKEVMDVWFDSGCMPFAQDHYPFDPEGKSTSYGAGNKKLQELLYPADYICEAIDQTRGWFYTLHAVGVLMGRGKAYKNVICLGHLLDAKGKKMSKSLGNIVDPWEVMDKYGVDTLRLWMYSVNQPGESKNFDEKTVALVHQQVFGLLYNVLAFYELYPVLEQAQYGASRDKSKSEHVLDQWILARLDELINLSTKNLDNYKLLEPTRAMRDFVGDLSTWYLRRSRERIKDEVASPAKEDGARQTLYFVLKTLSKILAPFAPFTAEDIWLKLRNENDAESVHLTDWPEAGEIDEDILGYMEMTRDVVSKALQARQKEKIPVRQPLSKLEHNYILTFPKNDYLNIIKNEVNVKDIKYNDDIEYEIKLDTTITPELKQEGDYRELARALQDMRKKMGLTPSDVINISFNTNKFGRELIEKFEADMKKTVLVSEIEFDKNDGMAIKVDNLDFKIKIVKI